MDKNTAIDKIKKCLALSKSDNPHEAAAALRQAQKLMALYKVDALDVSLADVTEETVMHPEMQQLGAKDRVTGRNVNASDFHAGKRAAKNAKLDRGMGTKKQERLA